MYDQNNIFAKILRKEVPAKVVYEDESVLAFHDISPDAKTHVLVIPKKEYIDFIDFTTHASPQEIATFFQAVNKVATQTLGLSHFKLCFNTGKESGQAVFHVHAHILSSQG